MKNKKIFTIILLATIFYPLTAMEPFQCKIPVERREPTARSNAPTIDQHAVQNPATAPISQTTTPNPVQAAPTENSVPQRRSSFGIRFANEQGTSGADTKRNAAEREDKRTRDCETALTPDEERTLTKVLSDEIPSEKVAIRKLYPTMIRINKLTGPLQDMILQKAICHRHLPGITGTAYVKTYVTKDGHKIVVHQGKNPGDISTLDLKTGKALHILNTNSRGLIHMHNVNDVIEGTADPLHSAIVTKETHSRRPGLQQFFFEWDVRTGKCTSYPLDETRTVVCAAKCKEYLRDDNNDLYQLEICASNRGQALLIAAYNDSGTAYCINTPDTQPPHCLSLLDANNRSKTPRGHTITGHQDGTVYVWSGLQQCHRALKGHTEPITHLTALKVDEKDIIITASKDNTVRIWDMEKAQCLHILHHQNRIKCLAFSKSNLGHKIFTATEKDTRVQVWDYASGKLEWTANAHAPINCIDAFYDGQEKCLKILVGTDNNLQEFSELSLGLCMRHYRKPKDDTKTDKGDSKTNGDNNEK